MRASVLVDSNVFITLLRRGRDPAGVLGEWIGEGELMTCGMVRLEVERGIKLPRVRRHVAAFFDVMLYGTTTNRIWSDAAQLAWELDRRGRILPSQDVLLAAIAQAHGALILTEDRHFEAIPGLKVLRPADEIDGWW